MSTINLHMPDSLVKHLAKAAERDGISVDQFVSSAVAEKLAALMTEEYISKRAARGSREKLREILDQVPGAEPDPQDQFQ